MTLTVSVDPLSATPPYEQIRSQVSAHAAAGMLAPGDRLPTVRALAAELGLATNTVARAYRELETEGVVTTRRRVGTVVVGSPAAAAGAASPGEAALERLQAVATELVAQGEAAGLEEEQLLSLVRGAVLRRRRR